MSTSTNDPNLFDEIGGESVVRQMVDRFYDLMELEPRFSHLRALHGPDLSQSRDRLFWFLCGWLGGPDLYISRLGHPRLRMRHLHVAIGVQARDEWLECMAQAMSDVGIPEGWQPRLQQSFFQTADWMRNQDEATRVNALKSGD